MAGAARIVRRVRDEQGIGKIHRPKGQPHRSRRQRVGLRVDQAKGRIGGSDSCIRHELSVNAGIPGRIPNPFYRPANRNPAWRLSVIPLT